jgi:methyltransferase (TIGR00027 family)
MTLTRAKAYLAGTAYLTAWARALGREIGGDVANRDHLAAQVLRPYQRVLNRVPRLARRAWERAIPGGFGYFNARTQYFDAVLSEEMRSGLEQLVILGAGFDSRSLRFADALRAVRVFEVDLPEVLALRTAQLRSSAAKSAVIAVPIDFEHEDLGAVLSGKGFSMTARTLFLWEGVTYYLPEAAVKVVLSLVARSGVGSSVLFDYVTRAFVDGDYSGYGTRRLAFSWRRYGDVNKFGVDDVSTFVQPLGFQVRSDIDATELERRYLEALPGGRTRAWGCMRIAHVAPV